MADSVPVIDIAHLESSLALVEIDRACRNWGFFQVVNHGIPAETTDALFSAAHRFFGQPPERKHDVLRTAENPWGFYDRELTKNTRDWKEVFDVGPADGNEQVPQWPDEVPGFRESLLEYYDACESLAHDLLAAISVNLGMPADFLATNFGNRHTSFLRLNFYPHRPETGTSAEDAIAFGVNEHTDAGALTILLQDAQPGLEVFRNGAWYLVEPRSDALVVNIGDIVQVWSNDRYRAALHRVVTNSEHDRYSIPFFFNPAWEADYAPLPTTVDGTHPARYRPINWREFRSLRHAGDYADQGKEVQISDYRI